MRKEIVFKAVETCKTDNTKRGRKSRQDLQLYLDTIHVYINNLNCSDSIEKELFLQKNNQMLEPRNHNNNRTRSHTHTPKNEENPQ